MSDTKTQIQYRGVGLGGLLTVLFIGLKLCNQIDWSWWWVLSPLWIPIALILGIFAIVAFFVFVGTFLAYCFSSKRR